MQSPIVDRTEPDSNSHWPVTLTFARRKDTALLSILNSFWNDGGDARSHSGEALCSEARLPWRHVKSEVVKYKTPEAMHLTSPATG